MRSRWRRRSPADADAAQPRCTATRRRARVEVLKIQNAARNSTEWFENVDRYTAVEAEQFAYSLLTRSQRISHENLRLRDRGFVAGIESLVRRTASACRRAQARPADVHAVHAARRDAAQPRGRVADGAVFLHRRHAGRLLPRASGQPRARRRRARVHRNDVRVGRCAHLAGMRRDVRAAASRPRGSASSTTCTRDAGAKIGMQLGHAGPKGSTQLGWEDADEPLAAGQLAADRALGDRVLARQPGPAGDDARRHGPRQGDFVRAAEWARRLPASTGSSCTARTATCCRLHLPADQPARRRLWRRARRTAAAFRSRYSARVRAVWPRGPADVGAHLGARLGARRQYAGRRGRDRAALQGRRSRPDRRVVRPDHARRCAGLRPHVPDAVRRSHPQRSRASRRWRSARSSSPTTSTASSWPGRADLCALARPHLADPYWTLHAAAQLGLPRHRVAEAVSARQGAARAQPRTRRADRRRNVRRPTDEPAPGARSSRPFRATRRVHRQGLRSHPTPKRACATTTTRRCGCGCAF